MLANLSCKYYDSHSVITFTCTALILCNVTPGFVSLSVPVANKRDTRSIEEAMNEIRAKKRLKKDDDTGAGSSNASL